MSRSIINKKTYKKNHWNTVTVFFLFYRRTVVSIVPMRVSAERCVCIPVKTCLSSQAPGYIKIFRELKFLSREIAGPRCPDFTPPPPAVGR